MVIKTIGALVCTVQKRRRETLFCKVALEQTPSFSTPAEVYGKHFD